MYYTYNDYINNNDIAIESFLSKALSKLQTLFAKLILKIDKMVKRMKDNRLKKILTNLLSRAKRGLAKCKSLNEHNPDMVRELQEEYNEINEEASKILTDLSKEGSDPSKIEVNGDKTIYYTDSSKKVIDHIDYKDGHVDYYMNGILRFINYEECPSEKEIKTKYLKEDGKTINQIKYKDGRMISYKNGKIHRINYQDCPSEKEISYKIFEDDGKTIKSIDYKDGHSDHYEDGKLNLIIYMYCPSEKKILSKHFEDDGKTISFIEYKDGHSVRYENGKPVNESYSTLESFMDYSAMMIAEESFSSIKSKIVTLFSRLVLWIESKVKKMKDGKIKSALMKLLSRAKRGLAKSKSLKEHNPDMVRELQEEASEIKEEVQEVVKEEEKIEKVSGEVEGDGTSGPHVEFDPKTLKYKRKNDGENFSYYTYRGKQYVNMVYIEGYMLHVMYEYTCDSDGNIVYGENTIGGEAFYKNGKVTKLNGLWTVQQATSYIKSMGSDHDPYDDDDEDLY